MMKKLFSICLIGMFWAQTAHADIEGDPFSTTQDFLEVQELESTKSLTLGGFIESRNQFAVHDAKTPISLRQKIHLEGLWKRDIFSVFASFESSFEGAALRWDGDNSPWNAELREIYLTYDTDTVDIFFGRKTHRWGTGDGINPMDLINPLDTEDPFSSGRTDNRIPVWMFSGTLSGKHVNLEGIFLPKAEVNALPPFGNPWEPAALHQLRLQEQANRLSIHDTLKPDSWFRDVEFGGRLSATLASWDISFMAFHGFSDNPLFVQSQNNGVTRLDIAYPSFSAFGMSFAKGFANQTIRGEVAFKPKHPVQGNYDFYRTNVWQGVFGWDYTIDARYYLNFQIFADIQESMGTYTHRHWFGGTYELSTTWLREAAKAGIRGKIYTGGDGTLSEVFLEYELNDQWKISTGILCWTGDANTILGEYTNNDALYMTVHYAF